MSKFRPGDVVKCVDASSALLPSPWDILPPYQPDLDVGGRYVVERVGSASNRNIRPGAHTVFLRGHPLPEMFHEGYWEERFELMCRPSDCGSPQ